jgi:hypothetical protein
MAAHHFEDEHLGGGARHRGDVERRLACRDRHVLGHRTEARAAVRDRQVVVHGLGHADAGDVVAHLVADLRDLVGGVHRVVAAVIEEVADVVGAEHLDQALVLHAVLLEVLQLVARRAERARGGPPQRADRRRVLLADVDQVLGQRPDDAVAAGVELSDPAAVPAACIDYACRGGVDHGGDTAGLCVEGIGLRGFIFGGWHEGVPGWAGGRPAAGEG